MTTTTMTDSNEKHDQSNDMKRRQRRKNLALMAVLVGWVVVLYLVAILRMSGEG
ncbi:MAG: hypothetical protein HOK54_04685 [Alphaproteobacteria bacterium]|jgi:hypothetical protein|nr:hypothetical protein [Alphaproteobacteria bacterium]